MWRTLGVRATGGVMETNSSDVDMSEGRLVGDKKYSPVASPRPDSRGRYLRRYISKF